MSLALEMDQIDAAVAHIHLVLSRFDCLSQPTLLAAVVAFDQELAVCRDLVSLLTWATALELVYEELPPGMTKAIVMTACNSLRWRAARLPRAQVLKLWP